MLTLFRYCGAGPWLERSLTLGEQLALMALSWGLAPWGATGLGCCRWARCAVKENTICLSDLFSRLANTTNSFQLLLQKSYLNV